MATKRTSGRRQPAGRKRVLAAIAKAAEDTGARTIVYVHGIGNKPIASVLKCQWDHALFGFDLGERSRLAYWVNRTFYPNPEDGRCESGDLVDNTAPAAEPGGMGVAAFDGEGRRDLVSRLTRNAEQQATLRSIASKINANTAMPSQQRFAALGVGAKVTPLPKEARLALTENLTETFLRDVHEFFFVPSRRKVMEESVHERLRTGGGPFVVIGHSQGSMIAYKVLCDLENAGLDVRLLVTIGSPLGLTEVKDVLMQLLETNTLRVPTCVKAWLNVADLLDPVALDKSLSNDYKRRGSVAIDDNLEWNKDSPRHPHSGTGYLATKPVRKSVRAAVDTALFQPVASFTIARDAAHEFENAASTERREVLIELAEVTSKSTDSLEVIRSRTKAAIHRVSNAKEALNLEIMERFIAADLTREEAEALAHSVDVKLPSLRRIWRNAEKYALLNVSGHTVQAIPARNAYESHGRDVHWAVLDTGIFAEHPHFSAFDTVATVHDCTKSGGVRDLAGSDRNCDGNGHGSHVAGIIAGGLNLSGMDQPMMGISPQTKLHVYKVLGDDGSGKDSWIIKALDHIASTNASAPSPIIHGINLSLGGSFDQSTFACGHTPLCRELCRLWRQGVVVVIAAGNEGFAILQSEDGPIDANIDISIGDPANLEEAIAVGSVHKEYPHVYGISYFSSRGPTADGRMKPDLVAPGEKILSCRHQILKTGDVIKRHYVDMSGTSMAAPHVSGVIAAFLSRRPEFTGYPDKVKAILLDACTDLQRDRAQQGKGLVNLVKMLVGT